MFERLLVREIVEYLETKGSLNDNQHGFRRKRSCSSQRLIHHQALIDMLENRETADAVYLGFAKAFDKVDHEVLIRKIREMGLGGKLVRWIYQFLFNRTQHVVIEKVLPEESNVVSGVVVLGPLLFMFIRDIDLDLNFSTTLSFADDTRITMNVEEHENTVKFQENLNSVHECAERDNLIVKDGHPSVSHIFKLLVFMSISRSLPENSQTYL